MPETNEVFDKIWDLYIPPIRQKISNRASEIAKEADRSELEAGDVFVSLNEYIPGNKFPSQMAPKPEGWWNRTFVGFTAVVALMTIAFGVLGVVGLIYNPAKEATSGFLEIAKIFAGAVIGGAVGSSTTSRK
ncbi:MULTISPECIES: hypothetical protein [unclassified Bradyrhizobium]|uniref:hypothetical protein n=1 Tax=unclassified Bradyrhizobium TaxID=2631580 RepID=UPI0028E4E88F|nr:MULTISPECIES: hypothetical protein [unclassified Bradyrhizobium]